MEGTERSALRAKYLDWCSARLAERFLDLSTEEIYVLARPEEAGVSGASPPEEALSDGPSSEPPVPSSAPAHGAEGDDGGAVSDGPDASRSGSGSPRLPRPTEEGYRVLVQRVTEALLKRTSLPTFEQWAEAYAEDPARFDAELLGFWKDAVEDGG